MSYRHNPNSTTLAEIDKTLQFIRERAPELFEREGATKWTEGHRVFFDPEGPDDQYTFMVGALKNGNVTWHMMPIYAVPELKERWATALRPFLSGKSCIQFKSFDELPQDALDDIVRKGTPAFGQVLNTLKKKKR
ncbi:hypothetical protein [Reinekea blandensis]|uniref:YdhG-like domain-containing protein n=1 Tax=Reinekea blandensis MED297 TaxID=314283 RepID=A4BCB3_9GAMM|nr:hypothetical protein [Reinekea blandensis]EAR10179.1 hypothetical protein MED297_13187 [Reinekea sp. MED297] [Reinekea blandensis MED297]